MNTFRVQIDSTALQKAIQESSDSKKYTQEFGLAAKQLHNLLESLVFHKYSVSKRLSSALLHGSASLQMFGRNAFQYSLEYKDKSLPIHFYATETYIVPVVEENQPRFPMRLISRNPKTWSYSSSAIRSPGNPIFWARRRQANQGVRVAIERGNFIAFNTIYGQPLFKVPSLAKTKIFTRISQDTWRQKPTRSLPGIRTPIVEPTGPSLAELAARMVETPEAQQMISNLQSATIYRIGSSF